MRKKLLENNYLYIPNFISKKRASKLALDFEKYCLDNNIKGDMQAENSSSVYNYIGFLELLYEKTKEVNKLLKEKVLPNYCYARVYRTGDDLKRHRDRPACEISLTLNLYKQKNWPIHIQKPNGQEVSLELNPGDAMLYLGCVADHWRNEITQDKYIQVFLHYNRSRGEHVQAHFNEHAKGLRVNESNNQYVNEVTKSWNLPYEVVGKIKENSNNG